MYVSRISLSDRESVRAHETHPVLAVAGGSAQYNKFFAGPAVPFRCLFTVTFTKAGIGFPLLFFAAGIRFPLHQPASAFRFQDCHQILCTVFLNHRNCIQVHSFKFSTSWHRIGKHVSNKYKIEESLLFFCFFTMGHTSVCPFSFCSCLSAPHPDGTPVQQEYQGAVMRFLVTGSQKYLGKREKYFTVCSHRPLSSGIRCVILWSFVVNTFPAQVCAFPPVAGVQGINQYRGRNLVFYSVSIPESRIHGLPSPAEGRFPVAFGIKSSR